MAGDFLLDENGDVRIENGDFVIGDAEAQHVDDLIYSFKGDWKEHPLLGAEAQRQLKQGNSLTKLKKAVKTELENDGYTNVDVTVNGNEIFINAERT